MRRLLGFLVGVPFWVRIVLSCGPWTLCAACGSRTGFEASGPNEDAGTIMEDAESMHDADSMHDAMQCFSPCGKRNDVSCTNWFFCPGEHVTICNDVRNRVECSCVTNTCQ